MKRILILSISLLIVLFACKQNPVNENAEIKVEGDAGIEFEVLEHNFDTLNYQDDATYKFQFTNIGDNPLLITNVRTSCGCTVSKYSKQPFKSKTMGYIEVSYDTDRIGPFIKTITVYSNASEQPIKLKIKGFVKNN